MMERIIFRNERHQQIVDLLADNITMSVNDLSNKLDVSTVTIRRDLDYLESVNYISRFHGSVTLIKPDDPHTVFQETLERNIHLKKALAKVAASLINPRDVISIDSGSTTYLIGEYLPIDYSIKVITNSLITALKFANNPKTQVIQVGGLINLYASSTVDFLATEFVHKLNSDIAFITTNSFNMPQGGFDSVVSLIPAKRAFMDITKRVVLMVDSSKFQVQSMYLSVPSEHIHTIITDNNTPREILQQIIASGKELIIVDPDSCSISEHCNKPERR